MKAPDIACKAELYCAVNASEDPEKVAASMQNIAPLAQVRHDRFSVTAAFDSLEPLMHIVESIHSRRSQKAYVKQLERNAKGDTTWLYLNKQAAFAGKVAICEDGTESPLGPVKLVISSRRLADVIEWFLSGEKSGTA